MRALLVEDEATTAEVIVAMLKPAGITLDIVDTGEEALELLRHYEYSIVLLDLMLPDTDGCEVVRRMRVSKNDVPVLVLSGLTTPQAKVRALSVGADDYLCKPFDKAELVARVQAVVRRSKGFSGPVLRVGDLELNQSSMDVCVAGQRMQLTGKEFAILELMMLRRGMVLRKDAFLNHLYGGMDEPESKIIDVFVCKLRKKLTQAGVGHLIETVWGHGYRMRDPRIGPSVGLAPPAAVPERSLAA